MAAGESPPASSPPAKPPSIASNPPPQSTTPRDPARNVPLSTSQSTPRNDPPPPSKRDLVSWWRQFKKNTKKVEEPAVAPPSEIFGVPLHISIRYANVAISLTGEDGKRFIYGYVPVVVAKCGIFLKEQATEVEGIFRLSGSAKRIKDLQDLFDAPDRYGKGLDWTGFTVHDAANVLRRYLNQLPEPIVPLSFYERFREPLCHLPNRKSVSGDEGIPPKDPPYNRDEVVATYQKLITELPSLNRQLLLYILDLLTVFAAKSDINRMTAANLAAIFQPGMLSHPAHYMAPQEYRLSQDVIVFLIENQDNFIIGMNGTAADEQTVKDVESGMAAAQQASSLRRSASNASCGADSLRKYEVTLRRNVSVSSKNSRTSVGTGSPTTPVVGRSPSGVHRSNTVPTKRPGLSPKVLQQRDPENTPSSPAAQKSTQSSRASSRTPSRAPSINKNSISSPLSQTNFPPGPANPDLTSTAPIQTEQPKNLQGSAASQVPPPATTSPPTVPTPTKEKKRSSFFGWVSPPEDGRQPNRLRKKRLPTSSASPSAHSSTNSLPTGSEDTLATASASHSMLGLPEPTSNSLSVAPKVHDTMTEKEKEEGAHPVTHANIAAQAQGEALSRIEKSRSHASSIHSRDSITDMSDADRLDERDKKDKRRSWRLHRDSKSSRDHTPASISSNARAEVSRTSFNSLAMSQENVPTNPHRANKDSQTSLTSSMPQHMDLSGVASPPEIASPGIEGERKGFFGKFKAKVAQVREELKEEFREAERSKSPFNGDGEKSASRNSLSMFSRDSKTGRGISSDNLPEQKPQEQHPVSTSPPQAPAPIESTAASQTPAIPEEETPEPSVAEKSAHTPTTSTESVTTATTTVLTTVEEGVPLTIPPPSETITSTAPPPPSSVVVPVPSTEKAGDATREPEVKEPEVKEPEVREPEVKEPEVREPEVKEPAANEQAAKESADPASSS